MSPDPRVLLAPKGCIGPLVSLPGPGYSRSHDLRGDPHRRLLLVRDRVRRDLRRAWWSIPSSRRSIARSPSSARPASASTTSSTRTRTRITSPRRTSSRDGSAYPRVMHRASIAPDVDVRIDDGETLIAGRLRLRAVATPGHTDDSISLVLADRVLTGDTLLRGATGRTDLPTGDPEALYESLFGKLLQLDDDARRLPGAQLQGRAGDDDRPGEGRESAPAEARSRRLRRADARPQPRHAGSSDRGAAHQPDRRQDGRAAARRGRAPHRVHVDGGAARAGRGGQRRARRARHPRARRLRRRPHPRRAARARAASSSCASTRCCPTRPCASSPAASSARSRPSPPTPCAPWATCARSRSTAG